MGFRFGRKNRANEITHEELIQRLEEKNKWMKEKLEELNKKMNGMEEEKVEKDEKVDLKLKDDISLNLTKKELHEKPINGIIVEVKQERILYCRKRIRRVEEFIKNSEKKLEEAKQKNDEKLIKKYEGLLDSLKKINTDLHDYINKMNRT
ncbi:MAG: hypothetical protein A3K77_07000 [Euryarchaeota archaeon RBG_13_31_8]|nr:MAG: hypothetical protein A3K77_07000 [Euryarchaeota archaeon RBG_13_31_8]